MTETAASSIDRQIPHLNSSKDTEIEYVGAWRVVVILMIIILASASSQIDRILPFILAESIKAELGLSETPMGLLTGLAFAVCYSLLSLPLARASDRGSPRFGPALGPLIVGMVSDSATAAHVANGLRLGLLTVPIASVLTGITLLIANQQMAVLLRGR